MWSLRTLRLTPEESDEASQDLRDITPEESDEASQNPQNSVKRRSRTLGVYLSRLFPLFQVISVLCGRALCGGFIPGFKAGLAGFTPFLLFLTVIPAPNPSFSAQNPVNLLWLRSRCASSLSSGVFLASGCYSRECQECARLSAQPPNLR